MEITVIVGSDAADRGPRKELPRRTIKPSQNVSFSFCFSPDSHLNDETHYSSSSSIPLFCFDIYFFFFFSIPLWIPFDLLFPGSVSWVCFLLPFGCSGLAMVADSKGKSDISFAGTFASSAFAACFAEAIYYIHTLLCIFLNPFGACVS